MDHFKNTIDQYLALGGKKLNLTPLTGEVFVSPFVLDQVDYALKAGIEDIFFYLNRFENNLQLAIIYF